MSPCALDFLAETKISVANTVAFNDLGIMARVANLADAGRREDYGSAVLAPRLNACAAPTTGKHIQHSAHSGVPGLRARGTSSRLPQQRRHL